MAKLTAAEIRKLIKAHNVLTKITIPKGANRDDLIKLVEKKGYSVDHEGKKISRKINGKPDTITLKGAEIIGKPKEKTALQKQKAAEKKEEKAVVQKKKERELKKEAVKKATKDMVPKTKPPKKIGAKPVPQKKPFKKEDEVRPKSKPGRPRVDPTKIKVIQPKKKEEPKKKKEKKKYDTEGAKKVGEAIKAKKVKLLTSKEYELLTRKAVKDITPTEKAQMEKYQNQPAKKEDKKEDKKAAELTDEKAFDSVLKKVLSVYFDNLIPNNVNDREENRLNKEVALIQKIYESKKTSNFTKPEISVLKRAVSVAKSNNVRYIKQFEDIVANLGSEKIRKGTVRERKSLATLKEKWSTGAKLTFKWSPEQVKQIEDILNNRDGIESQGYEQKESGTKWIFHFTKDGKQEKLMIKRPDPRPLKEIKELKEKN